jgi:prolipoprotein diacylglyceryltransferase
MDKNIVYGRIANFINLKVIGQKAREIREEKGIEPSELIEIYTFKELEEKINLYKFKNI